MTPEVLVNGRFLSRRISGVERHGREILSLIGDHCRPEITQLNGWRGHVWEQIILPRKLKQDTVLWSPANTGPLAISNQALTLHDLSPLEHPSWFRGSFAAWYRLFLPPLIKHVRVVFTPSEYVRKKIVRRFAVDNVVVTPNGVNRSIFHPNARQEKYTLPRTYILFVGTLEPRKNLAGLLKAWNRISHEYKDTWLVIAGGYGNVFGPLKLFREDERVRFLGYIEEEHLPGLYAGAALFVLPSFDEGFGLPVLEAMACGTPVIASDGGALPEVVGNAGALFKLSDPEGLSTALRDCLDGEQLRCSMRVNGLARAESFTWQRAADQVLSTLHEL